MANRSSNPVKSRNRIIAKRPRGTTGLEDVSAWDLSPQEQKLIAANQSFTFRQGVNLMVVKDGKIGNLKEWARALGLNYETVTRRRQWKWDIDRVLDIYDHVVSDHFDLSMKQRLVCPCSACKTWVLRHGRSEQAKDAKKKPSALVFDFPDGVSEPELWKKTVSGEYAFKYKGRYKTVADWADTLGLTKGALYARLVAYGMPIQTAVQPSTKQYFHGTRLCYQVLKCRCEDCKKANSDYYLAWKQKQENK